MQTALAGATIVMVTNLNLNFKTSLQRNSTCANVIITSRMAGAINVMQRTEMPNLRLNLNSTSAQPLKNSAQPQLNIIVNSRRTGGGSGSPIVIVMGLPGSGFWSWYKVSRRSVTGGRSAVCNKMHFQGVRPAVTQRDTGVPPAKWQPYVSTET